MKGKAIWVIGVLILLALALGAGGIAINKMKEDSKTPPTIALVDAGQVSVIHAGEEYMEPGYTALSADGLDLTAEVRYDLPDTSKPGIKTIRYQVEDRLGNQAAASRQVKVSFPKQTEAGKKRGLAIVMYHNVYDAKNPPADVDANMVSTETLKIHLGYLEKAGYYFPSWSEVREYLDGEIDLPEKSVVLTFDDAAKGFIQYGAPLIEKYDVRATSFVITSKNGKAMVAKGYKHINLQSHSHNMHRPGGNIGHGGVFTALSKEAAVKDLKRSQKILGNSDAFAYPFGDYTDACEEAVRDAGFKLAFTTAYGKIHPGDDPLLLPRVRINGNISLESFKESI